MLECIHAMDLTECPDFHELAYSTLTQIQKYTGSVCMDEDTTALPSITMKPSESDSCEDFYAQKEQLEACSGTIQDYMGSLSESDWQNEMVVSMMCG